MYSNSQQNQAEKTNQSGKKTQFLRFHLEPETDLVLPIHQILEVLTIATDKIVPIPQMPPWVMGVYNWRGEILWMVDLGHLFGLATWQEQQLGSSVFKAIVLSPNSVNKVRSEVLGLVVNSVEELEIFSTNDILSPPSSAVTTELAPFIGGYWLNSQGKMLMTLDGEAIMAAMPKI